MSIKIICDGSVGRSGVILHGIPPITSAHDAALGHAPPPKWDYLELRPGVNVLDITPEKFLAWQILARDAGLVIAEASGVYVVTDLHNGADSAVRYKGYRPGVAHDAHPSAAKDSRGVLERALASDRVVSVQ